jgi:hypothetical protein
MAAFRNALLFLALLPAPALADPSCFGLCSIDCVKPIAIPDRWNDNSVPGSVGWASNGTWDSEKFTDTNGNGLYDPGEPFQDGSSQYSTGAAGPRNGRYDSEFYDPQNTGFVASGDLGLEIILGFGVPGTPTVSTRYLPVDMPIPGNGSTGADRYRWNWPNCNTTLVSIGDRLTLEAGDMKGPTAASIRDLINQDPGAYWDDGCQCVNSSMGNESPRLIIVPAYDPRIPITAGGQSIQVTKLLGVFLESCDVNANVKGRLVQIHRTGANACPNGGDFIVDCAVPTKPVTWGAVKASYR